MEKKTVMKPRYEDVPTIVGQYESIVYITEDGKEFSRESEAIKHEWDIKQKGKTISFPYFVESFELKSEEELKNYEAIVLKNDYDYEKGYDSSNFTYPELYVSYTEDRYDGEQYGYTTELVVLSFADFHKQVLEKLESLKTV